MPGPRIARSTKLHDAVKKKAAPAPPAKVTPPAQTRPKPLAPHKQKKLERTAKVRDARLNPPPDQTVIMMKFDGAAQRWVGHMVVPGAGTFQGAASGRFKLVEILNNFWLQTLEGPNGS